MVYLALPPEYISEAESLNSPIAYMTYRICPSGHLLRAGSPVNGSIMYIDDSGTVSESNTIADEIVRECIARHFSGVVLDLSPGFPKNIAQAIVSACVKNNLQIYVPPHLAHCQGSIVLISTGISAGSLNAKLVSALRQYGAKRVALAIDYLRTDYTLPAKEGNGQELTNTQLNALITKYRSPSFFSKELCTYYFTYRTVNKAHLVLYDNAISIKRKLSIGKSLGIDIAFMFYPHVKNILSNILD